MTDMYPCVIRGCANGATAGTKNRCHEHLLPVASVEEVSAGLLAVTWGADRG